MEDVSNDQLFDEWNDKKKILSKRKNIPHFKEGEIWWCSCGQNLGMEMNGGKEFMRPVLIMRKFDGNGFMGMYISRQPH
ncbi:hypothetical protein IJ096_00290, partial [Candidatus Saccharibacteria bacterium]|nr:hypothetical protein [Candidatus Saccharibacteria bacterium]